MWLAGTWSDVWSVFVIVVVVAAVELLLDLIQLRLDSDLFCHVDIIIPIIPLQSCMNRNVVYQFLFYFMCYSILYLLRNYNSLVHTISLLVLNHGYLISTSSIILTRYWNWPHCAYRGCGAGQQLFVLLLTQAVSSACSRWSCVRLVRGKNRWNHYRFRVDTIDVNLCPMCSMYARLTAKVLNCSRRLYVSETQFLEVHMSAVIWCGVISSDQ